jgi:hypothetical protein
MTASLLYPSCVTFPLHVQWSAWKIVHAHFSRHNNGCIFCFVNLIPDLFMLFMMRNLAPWFLIPKYYFRMILVLSFPFHAVCPRHAGIFISTKTCAPLPPIMPLICALKVQETTDPSLTCLTFSYHLRSIFMTVPYTILHYPQMSFMYM